MPWNRFYSWFNSSRREPREPPMPLTLITLRGVPGSSADEVAFYTSTEFDTLVDWAMKGRFIMGFIARDMDELTLLCTESVEVMRMHVNSLPLVAAGLAEADYRVVSILRVPGATTSLH